MKLLHVDSSITGTQSVSRQLTAEIVAKLRQVTPDLDILPGPRSQAGAAFVWLHSCRAAAGSWAAERGGGA
jgi:hypothetical protein